MRGLPWSHTGLPSRHQLRRRGTRQHCGNQSTHSDTPGTWRHQDWNPVLPSRSKPGLLSAPSSCLRAGLSLGPGCTSGPFSTPPQLGMARCLHRPRLRPKDGRSSKPQRVGITCTCGDVGWELQEGLLPSPGRWGPALGVALTPSLESPSVNSHVNRASGVWEWGGLTQA